MKSAVLFVATKLAVVSMSHVHLLINVIICICTV